MAWLSVMEYARYKDWSKGTVYNKIHDGSLPHHHEIVPETVMKRKVWVDDEELEQNGYDKTSY